ncbi:MAG: HNH endonuclease [Chloroflexota bacterium]
MVWRQCSGPTPRGQDVDHTCNVTLCQRPDHLQLLTKPDNVKRRGPTRGPNKRAD